MGTYKSSFLVQYESKIISASSSVAMPESDSVVSSMYFLSNESSRWESVFHIERVVCFREGDGGQDLGLSSSQVACEPGVVRKSYQLRVSKREMTDRERYQHETYLTEDCCTLERISIT